MLPRRERLCAVDLNAFARRSRPVRRRRTPQSRRNRGARAHREDVRAARRSASRPPTENATTRSAAGHEDASELVEERDHVRVRDEVERLVANGKRAASRRSNARRRTARAARAPRIIGGDVDADDVRFGKALAIASRLPPCPCRGRAQSRTGAVDRGERRLEARMSSGSRGSSQCGASLSNSAHRAPRRAARSPASGRPRPSPRARTAARGHGTSRLIRRLLPGASRRASRRRCRGSSRRRCCGTSPRRGSGRRPCVRRTCARRRRSSAGPPTSSSTRAPG